MAIACKYCIAERGLRGSEIDSLPETEEELIEHIERVHHMPVVRENETQEEAEQRSIETYPEARICLECIAAGAPWTKCVS